MSRFRNIFRKTSDQRWILTEAVLFLFAAKILLIFLPVKTVMKVSLTSDGRVTEPDLNLLKDIKWALRHANRLSLWKNRCLVQSIAGRWMLQRRGIESQVVFGVKHDDTRNIVAHAWLKAGDFDLVDDGNKYQELFSY